jgi:hypothetical protein
MSPDLDMDALTEAMIWPTLCHCSDCKRRTGSAFGIAAYFPRKDVTHLKGETLVYALPPRWQTQD